MSGAQIRRAALAFLARDERKPEFLADLSRVVALCNGPFLQFIYDAGCDACLSDVVTCQRGVPITLQYAATQLCDDLSDGDCNYVSEPFVIGPLLIWCLQVDTLVACGEAGIPSVAVAHFARSLSVVGRAQYEELTTRRWTPPRALQAARELTGDQLAGYLQLLWAASPLEPLAVRVGRDLGTLGHLIADASTGDKRFWSLPIRGREQLLAEAAERARELEALQLRSVHTALLPLRKRLARLERTRR